MPRANSRSPDQNEVRMGNNTRTHNLRLCRHHSSCCCKLWNLSRLVCVRVARVHTCVCGRVVLSETHTLLQTDSTLLFRLVSMAVFGHVRIVLDGDAQDLLHFVFLQCIYFQQRKNELHRTKKIAGWRTFFFCSWIYVNLISEIVRILSRLRLLFVGIRCLQSTIYEITNTCCSVSLPASASPLQ